MKYLLINASPRGRESNSRLILSRLEEGISRGGTDSSDIETIDLRSMLKDRSWIKPVNAADLIVICFPLYADLVPGILKQFIEDLGRDGLSGKKLGWISQCGFPESIHLELTERYLLKVTQRLGAESAGIIKKAGAEGIRMMPPSMTKKLFAAFQAFGEDLAVRKHFDKSRAAKLAQPRKYNLMMRLGARIMNALGLTNFYWNSNLKKNGAYAGRFAKPYGQ